MVVEFCTKGSACILSSHNDDALNLSRTFTFVISFDQPQTPVGGGMGEKTEDQRKIENEMELPFLEYLLCAMCFMYAVSEITVF